MKKRILSIILSVCMLASVISINPISVKAAEVRNIALKTNGTTVETDHLSSYHETEASGLYKMERMIDGENTTNTGYFLCAGSTDKNEAMTVTLTFNGNYNISSVTLTPAWSYKYEGGFPEAFKLEIQTSNGWETVKEVQNVSYTGTEFKHFTYDFAETTGNALRIVTLTNTQYKESNGVPWYALRLGEFEVYGVEAPEEPEGPIYRNVALAENGTTVSSSNYHEWHESNSVNKMASIINGVKGSGGFYLSNSVENEYEQISVTLAFNQTYNIDKVVLTPAYNWAAIDGYEKGFPKAFKIEVKTPYGWKKVFEKSGCEVTGYHEFGYEIDPINCSAIRLVSLQNSKLNDTVYGLRLGEFEAYGIEASPVNNIALKTNGTTVSSSNYNEWHEDIGNGTKNQMASIINGTKGSGGFYLSNGVDDEYEQISVTLTFKQTYEVEGFVLTPAYDWAAIDGYAKGYPKAFKVEVQTQYGWVKVLEQSGCEITTYHEFGYGIDKIKCNAIRLVSLQNSMVSDTAYGLRLGEFEVFGVEAEALPNNIALSQYGTTVTASHVFQWYEDYGLKLERINDGNQSKGREFSFWASENVTQTTPVSVTMAFDKVYKISSIRLDPAYTCNESAGGFPEEFIISAYTTDGWKTIVSETGITDVTDWQTYTFPEVDCTAVKLTTVKNSLTNEMTYALRLGEMEVYGLESDAEVGLYEYSAVQAQGTAFASTSRNTSGGIKLSALNDEVTSPLWDCYSSEFFSNPNGVQFAGITFDSAYWFNEITLQTYADWMPENFYISVYDGAKWVEVLRKTDYAGEGSTHTFTFDDICGSAVKVTAEKMRKISRENMKGYGISFAEMIIKGLTTTEVIEQPATDLFNISSGMEVTVGSIVDWTAELKNPNNLIDNNRSTLYFSNWSPSADNCEWVQITFDAPMVAHYIDVYPWAEADISKRFPKEFEIQVYSGTNWKTVLAMKDFEITKEEYAGASEKGANLNSPFRFCFEPTKCSSIRLVATELDTTSLANEGEAFGLQLLDMNIYGDNATGIVAKPSNPKRGHQSPAAVVLSKGTNNEMLNDGDRTSPDNNYTSELVESADGTINMQFVFERPTTVDRIQFFPTDNGTFPTAFKVFAYTAEGWKLIKDAKDYTTYITGGFKLFSFKEVCCSSIIIQMTGLSELDGKYGVQLKDIDITGAIGTDTGVVLADGNGDDKLTEVDVPYVRQELLQDEQSGKYDFNMDATVDVRDLVRTKVYFANKN